MASGLGRGAIASLLLAGGADSNIQNQEGESPLDHAEYGKHEDLIKLLKDALEKATGETAAEGEGCGWGKVGGSKRRSKVLGSELS